MANADTVNEVIESFQNWQQPWTFISSVVGHPKCDDDDRKAIEAVWSAVCEGNLWLSGDTIQDCCVQADKAIAQQFPWLSVRARRQLINGAAYQWK